MSKRHIGWLLAVLASVGAGLSCGTSGPTQSTPPPPPPPTTRTVTLVNGVVSVAAGGWNTTQVNVSSNMLSPYVTGSFVASGGSGNDIYVYVMTAIDYTNWSTGHAVTPLYNSGQLTTAQYSVNLRVGTYYVVYDNSFSVVSAKNVRTLVYLVYDQ